VHAKLEQRLSGGLSYLVSYTRSKLVDDASTVFDVSILTGPIANYPVADSFNRHLERDYSAGDIPHVFATSAVWDLPVGANRRMHPNPVLGALVNDWTLTGVLRSNRAFRSPSRRPRTTMRSRGSDAAAQPHWGTDPSSR
jgi:hypothetical protein